MNGEGVVTLIYYRCIFCVRRCFVLSSTSEKNLYVSKSVIENVGGGWTLPKP